MSKIRNIVTMRNIAEHSDADNFSVSVGWSGWTAMERLFRKNGLQVRVPDFTKRKAVPQETIQHIAGAMGQLYAAKAANDVQQPLPPLDADEIACLAFALLLRLGDREGVPQSIETIDCGCQDADA